MRPLVLLSSLLVLALSPAHASAGVLPGDVAPAWTKTELDAPAPAERSLSDYSGRILIMFLLGYN